MEDIKDIERRNNETSDLGEKNEIIKHEDDKKCCQNDMENKVKDNENIGKDPEPIDSTPIEIESMSHATHSNMETLADTDFIQDFQQNQLAMELSEIVEPDAEVFEKDWTEQKELMLENVHQRVKFARQTDYATFLAQEAMNGGKVMQYDDVINEVIGAYDENEEEASSDEETDGEITVVDDAPSVTEPSPEEPVEETTAQ